MKVILKQDVEKLGDAGDIVDVADGYANNYLVPRSLAMRATKGAVADAKAIGQARQKREAKTIADAEAQKATIDTKRIQIPAKAGSDGTLYGSVGNAIIAKAATEQLGIPVDRRRVPLDRPIKQVGEHEVAVRLHRDVTATLKVLVIRGEGSADPAPEPAEDATETTEDADSTEE